MTTGSYSTVVALSKISGYILGAQCNCKPRAGGCCKHVAALLYNILHYVELELAIIQWAKLALTPHSNGVGQEISQVMAQFCFPKYICTIHTERKADVAAAQSCSSV